MSDKITSVRSLIMALAAILFASTLFDAIYGFKNLIQPGISLVYNAIGISEHSLLQTWLHLLYSIGELLIL